MIASQVDVLPGGRGHQAPPFSFFVTYFFASFDILVPTSAAGASL